MLTVKTEHGDYRVTDEQIAGVVLYFARLEKMPTFTKYTVNVGPRDVSIVDESRTEVWRN